MISATASERQSFRDMLTKLKPSSDDSCITYILEFCCDSNSEIGSQAEHVKNVQVFRATEELNILTKQGLQRCIDFLESHKGSHLWGSIPCTPWSQIQNLNIHMHGKSSEEYLAEQRRISMNVLGRFLTLARIVKKNGGTIVLNGREWLRDGAKNSFNA